MIKDTMMFGKYLFTKRWFTSLVGLMLLAVMAVGIFGYNTLTQQATRAHAAGPCANLQPGEMNDGFNNTNTSYTDSGGFQSIGSQKLIVNLDGSDNCDEPGSRYVRAVARLWSGSGSIDAFVEQQLADGSTPAIPGTSFTKNPSDFFNPTYSNIYNATGLTVRACGNFHTGGLNEVHCDSWITVPA